MKRIGGRKNTEQLPDLIFGSQIPEVLEDNGGDFYPKKHWGPAPF